MINYKQGALAQRDIRAALLEKRRTPSDVTRKAVKKKKKKSEADRADEPTFSLKKILSNQKNRNAALLKRNCWVSIFPEINFCR